MKARLATSFAIFLIVFALVPVAGEEKQEQPEKQQFQAYEGQITTDRVNLRSGPGQNFTRLLRVNKGYFVTVIDRQGDWLRIAMPPECLLWIHSDYVKPERGNNMGIVTGSRVNVRVGPEPEADVVGQVTRGMALVITGRIGEWFEIRPPSTTSACVHADLVKPIEPGK